MTVGLNDGGVEVNDRLLVAAAEIDDAELS
jgi:hypothetical protein